VAITFKGPILYVPLETKPPQKGSVQAEQFVALFPDGRIRTDAAGVLAAHDCRGEVFLHHRPTLEVADEWIDWPNVSGSLDRGCWPAGVDKGPVEPPKKRKPPCSFVVEKAGPQPGTRQRRRVFLLDDIEIELQDSEGNLKGPVVLTASYFKGIPQLDSIEKGTGVVRRESLYDLRDACAKVTVTAGTVGASRESEVPVKFKPRRRSGKEAGKGNELAMTSYLDVRIDLEKVRWPLEVKGTHIDGGDFTLPLRPPPGGGAGDLHLWLKNRELDVSVFEDDEDQANDRRLYEDRIKVDRDFELVYRLVQAPGMRCVPHLDGNVRSPGGVGCGGAGGGGGG
jgi:hypothetical protein